MLVDALSLSIGLEFLLKVLLGVVWNIIPISPCLETIIHHIGEDYEVMCCLERGTLWVYREN